MTINRAGSHLKPARPNNPLRRSRWSIDAAQAREGGHEGVRAQLPVALRLRCDVELIGERQARQREIHALRLGERNAEVLDEVIDLESRREIAPEDPRGVVGQRPRREARDKIDSLGPCV